MKIPSAAWRASLLVAKFAKAMPPPSFYLHESDKDSISASHVANTLDTTLVQRNDNYDNGHNDYELMGVAGAIHNISESLGNLGSLFERDENNEYSPDLHGISESIHTKLVSALSKAEDNVVAYRSFLEQEGFNPTNSALRELMRHVHGALEVANDVDRRQDRILAAITAAPATRPTITTAVVVNQLINPVSEDSLKKWVETKLEELEERTKVVLQGWGDTMELAREKKPEYEPHDAEISLREWKADAEGLVEVQGDVRGAIEMLMKQ